MKATVIGYAVVLCVALGGAYQTWTHEGDVDTADATVILDVKREQLEAVTFENPSTAVRLELREDALGPYVWATITPAEDQASPQASPQAFKAGPAGETVAQGMAPFVAKRVLEGVDASKLAELGFGEEQGTLTLSRKDRDAKVYEVGAKAYGGSNRYVRDPDDGTIYIVAANLIDTLETGERTLPDRSLVAFEVTDIETITVAAAEAEATYVQNNPDDRAARFWAAEGSSEPNPAAAGWFDKALRLRVAAYLDAEPSGAAEAFSMTLTAGRKSTEVVVYRGFATEGEERWYATSAHNRAWVQLHTSSAAEAAADLVSVLDVAP